MDLATLKDLVRVVTLFGSDDKMQHCPLHTEKTPSCHIDDRANRWHCFGCGVGGSSLDYLILVEGLSVGDGIQRLHELAGVEYKQPTPQQVEVMERTQIRERALAFAATYFRERLTPEATDYLTGRGFTLETIERLGLGVDDGKLGWFARTYPEKLPGGLIPQDLIDCGLCWPGDGGKFGDTLAKRVVFPVMVGGRVRTMTGRDLTGESKAKWKHLAGKDKADKPLRLGAGLDWLYLEDTLRRSPEVCVVEGPADAVIVDQWGHPVCGLLGVGSIRPHAKKFKGKAVWLAFDNDKAGREAVGPAARALDEAGARAVYVLFPPDPHKDWSDWAAADGTADAFRELKAAAPNYITSLIMAIDPHASPEVKGSHLIPIWDLLARRPAVERDAYIKTLAKHAGITAKVCRDAVAAAARRQADAVEAEAAADPGRVELVFEDRRLLCPAMDFDFDGEHPVASTTVYVQVRTPTFVGGEVVNTLADAPYLIRSTITPDGPVIECLPLSDLNLSKEEWGRVPAKHVSRGRWQLAAANEYGVEAFVNGRAPRVDAPKLFEDLRALIKSYVHLRDPRDLDMLACWIMQSYLYRAFPAIGYLWLHGQRESGKSTIGQFLADLCFNGRKVTSATEAVLFRMIEANCCTMMIDEAEKLESPDPKSSYYQLGLLCNDGYKFGASAERCESQPDGRQVTVSYDAYSPKVFASIRELNFVLASRCIQVSSEMASAEDVAGLRDVAQNLHRLQPVFADLRDRLQCWALSFFAEVHQAHTQIFLEDPDMAHLRGRQREMWLPLISIAAHLDFERFGEVVGPDDDRVQDRLLDLQRDKSATAKAVENNARLDLFLLQVVYETIETGELKPVKISYSVDGDFFATKDIADLVTKHAREAGVIGPDKTVTARMVKTFLRQLGAVVELEKDQLRVDGGAAKRVTQIAKGRFLSAMERAGVAPPD